MARGLLFVLLLGASNLWGSPHLHKNVLVLVSDEPNLPAVATGMEALRSELEREDPAAISLFTEYLDLNRFENQDYHADILRWEQRKYRSIALDLIVCVTVPALRLVLAQRDQLWPGVPLTFMGIEPDDLAGTKLPPAWWGRPWRPTTKAQCDWASNCSRTQSMWRWFRAARSAIDKPTSK